MHTYPEEFYTNRLISQTTYSYTPPGEPDFGRILDGEAGWQQEEVSEFKKKKLIVRAFYICKLEYLLYNAAIRQLLDDQFEVYYYADQTLIPWGLNNQSLQARYQKDIELITIEQAATNKGWAAKTYLVLNTHDLERVYYNDFERRPRTHHSHFLAYERKYGRDEALAAYHGLPIQLDILAPGEVSPPVPQGFEVIRQCRSLRMSLSNYVHFMGDQKADDNDWKSIEEVIITIETNDLSLGEVDLNFPPQVISIAIENSNLDFTQLPIYLSPIAYPKLQKLSIKNLFINSEFLTRFLHLSQHYLRVLNINISILYCPHRL